MSDNEEGERTVGNKNENGNEWEVIKLTASAYAAAPGPHGVESIHEEKGANATGGSEAESSHALFMSGHFAFPPSEHENLPIKPDTVAIHKEDMEANPGTTEMLSEGGGRSEQKVEENWRMRGLNVQEEFSSLYDDKGNRLSIHGPVIDEATALHALNDANVETDTYRSAKFSSFHADATVDAEEVYDESTVPTILPDPSSELNLNPSERSHSLRDGGEDKDDRPQPSPGAWWKRQVASLCAHAKETNAFWSVFIAAAVMGLVILGQRWQQERWQVLQQRWQLSLKAERSSGPCLCLMEIASQLGNHIKGIALATLSVLGSQYFEARCCLSHERTCGMTAFSSVDLSISHDQF